MRTRFILLFPLLYLGLCLSVLAVFGAPAIAVLVISVGIGSVVAAFVVIGKLVPTGSNDHPRNRTHR